MIPAAHLSCSMHVPSRFLIVAPGFEFLSLGRAVGSASINTHQRVLAKIDNDKSPTQTRPGKCSGYDPSARPCHPSTSIRADLRISVQILLSKRDLPGGCQHGYSTQGALERSRRRLPVCSLRPGNPATRTQVRLRLGRACGGHATVLM